MIPRFKAYFNYQEIFSVLNVFQILSRQKIELKISKELNSKYALTFMYGRTGLIYFLKSMEICHSEIIVPAYTCSVVIDAILFTGNKPVFIDINSNTFNMFEDKLPKKITDQTKAIIVTNMYGYPNNMDKIIEIINSYKNKIYIIQDCALAYKTTYKNNYISRLGDCAIYGGNIGKQLCFTKGGILTTDSKIIYDKISQYRLKNEKKQTLKSTLFSLMYFFGLYIGFTDIFYSIVNFLERKTCFLNKMTKYTFEEKVYIPKDYDFKLNNIQLKLLNIQFDKLEKIIRKRKKISKIYHLYLSKIKKIKLQKYSANSSYSHFSFAIENRNKFVNYMNKNKVNVGQLFNFYLPAFQKCYDNEFYPVAKKMSSSIVNIPNYPSLSSNKIKRILKLINKYFENDSIVK